MIIRKKHHTRKKEKKRLRRKERRGSLDQGDFSLRSNETGRTRGAEKNRKSRSIQLFFTKTREEVLIVEDVSSSFHQEWCGCIKASGHRVK